MVWLFLIFSVLPLSMFPLFEDNLSSAKWIIVTAIASIVSVMVLLRLTQDKATGLKLPNRNIGILISLIVLVKTISLVVNFSIVSLTAYVESLTFIGLTLIFLNFNSSLKLNLKSIFVPYTVGLVGVLAYSFKLFIECKILNYTGIDACFAGTFGNINILAEYLVLTMPLLIYFVNFGETKNKIRVAQVMLVMSLLLVGLAHGRSAYLGVIFIFLADIIMSKKITGKIYKPVAASVLLFVLVSNVLINSSNEVIEQKKESSQHRQALFKGTVAQILDNPKGIGMWGFEFGFTPYKMSTLRKPSEKEIEKGPHSEFLKWTVEEGWIFLVSLFLGIRLLAHGFQKNRSRPELWYFFVLTGAGLLPQLVLQFPFDNGFSFVYLSFVFALFLDSQSNAFVPNVRIKLTAAIIALVLFVQFVTFTTSKILEMSHPFDLAQSQVACRLYPANWRACLNRARAEIESGQMSQAEQTLKNELKLRPYNFVALQYLIVMLQRQQRVEEVCEVLSVFDTVFDHRSIMRKVFESQCGADYKNILEFKDPKSFHESYILWLEKFIKSHQ